MITLALALIVQEVDLTPKWITTEPEMAAKPDSERPDMIPLRGGGYIHLSKDAAGATTRRVVINGRVAIREGLIELFICAEGGKDYESAVTAVCDVQQLDLSMVLSGMKKGRLREKQAEPIDGEGSRVLVLVQWKEKDGPLRTCRAEDLIHDVARNRTMPRVGWTYIGGWEDDVDPVTNKPTGSKFLRAARTRTLLATFSDAGALLDNPILKQGRDDTACQANGHALPPSGTELKLIFRLPTADERAEIENLEKELAKE